MKLVLKNSLVYFVPVFVSAPSCISINAFVFEVWCVALNTSILKKDKWGYNFIAVFLLQNVITKQYALYTSDSEIITDFLFSNLKAILGLSSSSNGVLLAGGHILTSRGFCGSASSHRHFR